MNSQALIRANDLTVNKGKTKVLQNQSFSLFPSEVVALVGPNGSGKTTLIEACTGIVPLRNGQVFWKSRRESEVLVRDSDGRRNAPPPMGLTLQKDAICGDETVFERLSIALQVVGLDASEDTLLGILSEWGLSHRSGSRASELSGGLKRRLSLVCGLAPAALSDQPIAVILDEPSEGLDDSSQELMRGWVKALSEKGNGVLIATHDQTLISYSDRIIKVSEGKLSESFGDSEGSPLEIPDFHIENNPRSPIATLIKWSFLMEKRNPIDTIGKSTIALLAMILAFALVGDLDPSAHGGQLLAAMVLTPAFITAISAPALAGRLSEADCGRWWDAVTGPMSRPACSVAGASLILPIPVTYLSWLVLDGSIDPESSIEVLKWLWLPALSMIDVAIAATALHLLISDLSRSNAVPASLMLIVLVWPFLELTEALGTIIEDGMSFGLGWGDPITTCIFASLTSALVWLAAILIPEY
ncbi:MAG TPA: ATP-binding cassette domain-containing protein [Candidatus Thalassarchaeaceae archaeon]|nr:ATP-binding cassette domain-containing protein [Candidatus Thalassarchaeaceae archaeon]